MKRFALLIALLGFGLTAFAQTPPSITTQPQDITVNPGYPTTLTVGGAGAGTLSYRWFKNGAALADGNGFSGTSTAELTLAAAKTGDAGSYTVIVSNSGGSVTSNPAVVTVAIIYVPAFTSASTLTVAPGSPFTYAIAASNSPVSFNATGLPSGLTVDGATGLIAGTPTTQGIFPITLSATNAVGTATATLTLTVEAALPSYADQLVVGAAGSGIIAPGKLSAPANAAVDAAGNVFVADPGSHTIVRVDPAGVLSLVAGTPGQGGSADGVGGAASFLSPGGIAADGSGNLFVADTGNHTIRKITADGTVSTMAGAVGQAGSADGVGAAARFFSPKGIAADTAGTLYVADTTNHTIRKITPAGAVSTLAGLPGAAGNLDGLGGTARFNSPNSLAVDRAGTVYVADGGNNAVRKISGAGAVTTLVGSFAQPSGIAVDPMGNVFVADTANNAVKEVTAVGTLRRIVFSAVYRLPSPPNGPQSSFATNPFRPVGMACDAAGNFYWFDNGNITAVGLHKAAPFFPVTITVPPRDLAAVSGTTVQFSATATGEPINYAWYGPGSHRAGVGSFPIYVNSSVEARLYSDTPYNYNTNAGTYGVIAYNIGSSAKAEFQLTILPEAPEIVVQPAALATTLGQSATFTVSAKSKVVFPGSTFTYAWSFNGTPIDGATGSSYTIGGVQAADAGTYSVVVTETSIAGVNTTTSAPAALTVAATAAPQVTVQPQSLTVKAGAGAILSVAATGAPAPTYQWSLNGTPIPGATATAYSLSSVRPADGGSYQVTVTNAAGAATSDIAMLAVVTPPVVARAPQAQAVYAGNTVTLSVAATGGALSYQWLWNGVAVPGANDATLTIAGAQLNRAGSYAVVVTNLAGAVTTDAVAVEVITTRLANLSARGPIGGGNVLSVGFVTNGSAAKQLLVRGVGPTLASFGLSGVLSAPLLQLFDAQRLAVGSNAGWSGTAALKDAFGRVGAFALPVASADSALLANLPGGLYTAQVGGVNGASGVALAEIYDADAGTPASRLVNLSALGFVGTGGDVLIAGFVITGNRPARILVRAIGPTLAAFAVPGALTKPVLTLVDGTGKTVATGAAWGGAAELGAAFVAAGAFGLPTTSDDAALLVTLAPGSYTALVSGLGGATGVALVELYDMPQ